MEWGRGNDALHVHLTGEQCLGSSAMSCSISSTPFGTDEVRFSFPSAVMRMSSSIRIPVGKKM